MSADETRQPKRRRRQIGRAELPAGPALELRDVIYELYLNADSPTLDEIVVQIKDSEDLPGAPGRDVVSSIISGRAVSATRQDTVTVAVALFRRAVSDPGAERGTDVVAARIRRLWNAARKTPRSAAAEPRSDAPVVEQTSTGLNDLASVRPPGPDDSARGRGGAASAATADSPPVVRRERWSTRRLLGAVVVGSLGIAAVSSAITVLYEQTREPPVNSPASSAQESYKESVRQDRQALFDGYVWTEAHQTGRVGKSTPIVVRVCGAKSIECAASAAPPLLGTTSAAPTKPAEPTPMGPFLPSATIKIGGQVRAHATTDMPGRLEQVSAEVQPLILDTDFATWRWSIRPSSGGYYTIQVLFTVLSSDTGTPLLPDESIEIPLSVEPTEGPGGPVPGGPGGPERAPGPSLFDWARMVAIVLFAVVGLLYGAAQVFSRAFSADRRALRRLRSLRRRTGSQHVIKPVNGSNRVAWRAHERAEAAALDSYRQHADDNPDPSSDDMVVQLALLGERLANSGSLDDARQVLRVAIDLYQPLRANWPHLFDRSFDLISEIAHRVNTSSNDRWLFDDSQGDDVWPL